MRRIPHLSLFASTLALLVAGCGGGAAGGGADPAKIMPATAAVYVEAVVHPEGGQKDDILEAAGKILQTDEPEKKLRELFDQAVKEGEAKVDYDKDIKPWLGERAGVYVTNFEKDEPDFLVAVATTDAEKAEKTVFDSEKRAGTKFRDGSYKGTDYKIDEDGVATGIIDDFIAFGQEAQFKQAVDASKGKSLADDKRFEDALSDLDDDRVGEAFVDLEPLFDAAAKQDPESAGELEQARRLFGLDSLEPITAAFLADGDKLAIDTSMPAGKGDSLLSRLSLLQGAGPGEMLGELPGDAWFAYGIPKLGEAGKAIYDQLAGALGGAAVSGQIKEATGLDLQQDIFAWIGDTALFVRGESESNIEGALVIEATDEAKARNAVTKLVGAAAQQSPAFGPQKMNLEGADLAFQISGAGTPQPVIAAVGKGRAVFALGEKAAKDGLEAGEKLADDDTYKAALDSLEDNGDPSFYLDMAAVLKLAQSSGTDPEFEKARPYLEAMSAVIAAGKKDGDRVRSRLAVGLK